MNAQGPEAGPENPTKICSSCSLLIPATAKLCTHCSSYQNWRGFLGVSQTTLALIVAVVSSITAAIPVVTDFLKPSGPQIKFSSPIIRGTQLIVLATNTGNEPGVISSGAIHSEALFAIIQPHNPADHVVAPGAKQIIFDVRIEMSAATARRRSGGIYEERPGLNGTKAITVKRDYGIADMAVTRSDGRGIMEGVSLASYDVDELLLAHAQRCEMLKGARIPTDCVDASIEDTDKGPATSKKQPVPEH